MTTKYTPGPWRAGTKGGRAMDHVYAHDGEGEEMKQWRYVRSGYGSKNADFDIVNESGGRVASTPYENKAKLIAAAPSMAELLREFVTRFNSDESVIDICDEFDDKCRALLQRIEE